MTISFIYATDQQGAIGLNNSLPWRLPADLKYFKAVTMGHAILMGRKTYESIGKPLPGRENVILTQNQEYEAEGCVVVHSVEETLQRYQEKELFVTGGAEIFRLFLPYVDKLYITLIEDVFEADTYFRDIDLQEWSLVSSEQGLKDEKNPYIYTFQVYERGDVSLAE